MSSTGRGFDRASSSIYPLPVRTGGIRPLDRMRSRLALSLAEREEISPGLTAQLSVRSTARSLKPTVCCDSATQGAQNCRYIVKRS